MIMNSKLGVSGGDIQRISPTTVRKTSPSVFYNDRLVAQYHKHQMFSSLVIPGIAVPKLFSIKTNEVRFYLEIEYINGLSFDEYLIFSTSDEIWSIWKILKGYIDYLISVSSFYSEYEIKEKITIKLESMYNACVPQHKKLILGLMKEVDEGSFCNVPKSICHGDLTFSNMIFHKNTIYLIDFLDSYIDSFLVDLVKLKQDLYYYWSIELAKINPVHKMRTIQVFNFMWELIKKEYNLYTESEIFHIIDIINLLRIEPYITSEKMHEFLNLQIERTLLYDKFGGSDSRSIN